MTNVRFFGGLAHPLWTGKTVNDVGIVFLVRARVGIISHYERSCQIWFAVHTYVKMFEGGFRCYSSLDDVGYHLFLFLEFIILVCFGDK